MEQSFHRGVHVLYREALQAGMIAYRTHLGAMARARPASHRCFHNEPRVAPESILGCRRTIDPNDRYTTHCSQVRQSGVAPHYHLNTPHHLKGLLKTTLRYHGDISPTLALDLVEHGAIFGASESHYRPLPGSSKCPPLLNGPALGGVSGPWNKP